MLEGPAMTAEPGFHALIGDQLCVHVLAARERHDEEPRLHDLAGMDIGDDGACTKVDLNGLGRGMVKEDRGRCCLLVAPDEALHGVVAAREPVTLNQSLMDGRGLNAPLHLGADEFSHRSRQGL
jgi:hypothetical protein